VLSQKLPERTGGSRTHYWERRRSGRVANPRPSESDRPTYGWLYVWGHWICRCRLLAVLLIGKRGWICISRLRRLFWAYVMVNARIWLEAWLLRFRAHVSARSMEFPLEVRTLTIGVKARVSDLISAYCGMREREY